MNLLCSDTKTKRKQCSKNHTGHSYEEEAFKHSRLALSTKSAVQSLCLNAIQWANTQIQQELRDGRKKKALDIGCAYGYVTCLLNHLKYDSTGIDISKYALKLGEKVNRVRGDAEDLPFKSDSVDIITCFDTFEHLSQPTLLLKESYRCLRWGGVLIIENPTLNPIDAISDKLHKMDEIHCSLLWPRQFISYVREVGFRTARRGLLPIPFQRFPVFGRFIEVPVPVAMARRILIVATKS